MANDSMVSGSRSSSSGASPEPESKAQVLEGLGVGGGEGPAPRTRRTAPPRTSERRMSVLRCTTASTVASLVAWLCWGCAAAQHASVSAPLPWEPRTALAAASHETTIADPFFCAVLYTHR
jgi:hypothetical protein